LEQVFYRPGDFPLALPVPTLLEHKMELTAVPPVKHPLALGRVHTYTSTSPSV